MYYVLDRFEEDFAVLENIDNTEIINIKKDLLSDDIKEGDVLENINDTWIFNKDKTEERRKKIDDKFNSLWK